jgi:hypothetical protein
MYFNIETQLLWVELISAAKCMNAPTSVTPEVTIEHIATIDKEL